ncbi:MAG: hypothetical protein IKI08_01815 [Selenomonadaceae bacterium]|nr:hypothetical protein [Selenomonadaceae bacterium]
MKKFLAILTVLLFTLTAVTALAAIQWRTCTKCHGTGKCQKCGGTAYVTVWRFVQQRDKDGKKNMVKVRRRESCSECQFKGRGKCSNCKGTGRVEVRI